MLGRRFGFRFDLPPSKSACFAANSSPNCNRKRCSCAELDSMSAKLKRSKRSRQLGGVGDQLAIRRGHDQRQTRGTHAQCASKPNRVRSRPRSLGTRTRNHDCEGSSRFAAILPSGILGTGHFVQDDELLSFRAKSAERGIPASTTFATIVPSGILGTGRFARNTWWRAAGSRPYLGRAQT